MVISYTSFRERIGKLLIKFIQRPRVNFVVNLPNLCGTLSERVAFKFNEPSRISPIKILVSRLYFCLPKINKCRRITVRLWRPHLRGEENIRETLLECKLQTYA